MLCLAHLLETVMHPRMHLVFSASSFAVMPGSETLTLRNPALQVALRHRLERQAAKLVPVRKAFRLAEGPVQGPGVSPTGDAAASTRVHSMRGVLNEAHFATFCALIDPAITPRKVAVLLGAMAPGGARQARPHVVVTCRDLYAVHINRKQSVQCSFHADVVHAGHAADCHACLAARQAEYLQRLNAA